MTFACRSASAFELWMAENQTELEEEHPDLSSEELSRMAADKFRNLPREERQVWLQKAKAQKQTENDGDSDKKRKRSEEKLDDDVTPSKVPKTNPSFPSKKPLAQSTNAKLAKFAFTK
jgi:hypothetical protein